MTSCCFPNYPGCIISVVSTLVFIQNSDKLTIKLSNLSQIYGGLILHGIACFIASKEMAYNIMLLQNLKMTSFLLLQ